MTSSREALGSDMLGEELVEIVRQGLALLDDSERRPLESKVPGKDYFMFVGEDGSTSRPINAALFNNDPSVALDIYKDIVTGPPPEPSSLLDGVLYTAAMSYCAATDITKRGDKKTPGTFFEFFVGHLVARRFDAVPERSVKVPTLDIETSLPTDFVFDLGPGRSRIHLPIKTSTRERVVQVWAHQRVLDGMHGVGRFRGLLVALAETNKQKEKSVVEVCLPNQWVAYQMYIAQMHRVYYLDPPSKYLNLAEDYPFIQVMSFSRFFEEADEIVRPVTS